ncbi:type IX secretion system membrane protein PorP/SprF [Sphingobacteriales bacterium UPWRP_1]|nr:hypothetical protein B6N25_00880 [Sphingobacteriales bacterium TSM_CSS]PSJ72329.1 type IX secretion system membrane protein PorP/SprF [Sphingobacteriales bacterium UPWRP_1]
MKTKQLIRCLLLICCTMPVAITAVAQDVHWSQFYTDVFRLNPSMTGNFNGDYRIGLNARNQWQSVPAPYRTISAYADFGLLKARRRNGTQDWIGTGVNFLYDHAGDGRLSMLEVRGALAGHKSLSENIYVSAGVNAAFRQRSVDFQKLYFGNQWSDVDFDPNLPNLENLGTETFGYLDVNAGATVSYQVPDKFNFYLGASALHVNRPDETFYDSGNRLGTRLAVNTGAAASLGNLILEPAAYFTLQKKAQEIVFGTNFVWVTNNGRYSKNSNNVNLYLGAWYRWADAIIALGGLEFSRYRLLLSYDINTSALKPASNSRGGFELSFVHVGSFNKQPKTPIYCPRF